jgi:hypothetical protein
MAVSRLAVPLRTMAVIRIEEACGSVGFPPWAKRTLEQGSQSGLANEAAGGDVLPDCIALPAPSPFRNTLKALLCLEGGPAYI